MKVARIQRKLLSAWCVFLSLLVAFFVVCAVPASASSALLYEGSVTWAIGRRNSENVNDWNYSTVTESVPRMSSVGDINPSLCGIPSNRSTNTFTSLPGWISVTSQELVQNGGYCYVTFCLAYTTDTTSFNSVTLNRSNIKAYLALPGALTNAIESGTELTVSAWNQGYNSNTAFSVDTQFIYNTNDIVLKNTTRYDGSNFPHVAYMFDGTNLDLKNYGLNDSTLYDFGDTSLNWHKTFVCTVRVDVPATNTMTKNVVWINLSTAILGSFKSIQNNSVPLKVSGTDTTARAYLSNVIYLCPISCLAVSKTNYDAVEVYLSNIYSSVNNIDASVQQLVDFLNQSHSISAEIESQIASNEVVYNDIASAGSQLNEQMQVNKPSISNFDIFSEVDQVSRNNFKAVMGSIFSIGKVGVMLLIVGFLALISYVFFGKR